MWWGWAVLAALVRFIIYNMSAGSWPTIPCVEVDWPRVCKSSGQPLLPFYSLIIHGRIAITRAFSWRSTFKQTGMGSCYLYNCWIIWKVIPWKYGTAFNVWKHQTRFYWVCLFEIMVISLMPRSSTTKATTRHHHHHNNHYHQHHHHHHRTIRQSRFFSIAHSLCKKLHGAEVPAGAL